MGAGSAVPQLLSDNYGTADLELNPDRLQAGAPAGSKTTDHEIGKTSEFCKWLTCHFTASCPGD